MSDLADKVLLTRLVDRLAGKGYLPRDDRRGSYAVLNEAGIEAMRGAWPVYASVLNERFAAHLTEA